MVDAMEERPIRCAIELDVAGGIRLVRSPGCTPADARELCRLVADDDAVVRDMTDERDT